MRCHTTHGLTLTGKRPKSTNYPKLLKTVGDHLRTRRLDLGLLQRDVAGLMCTDLKNICNWELNHKQPSLHYLPRIVEFLGYDFWTERAGSIGGLLRMYRNTHGLTQKKFAKVIGIDPTTLSRIERGKRNPMPSTVKKITQFLASVCDNPLA